MSREDVVPRPTIPTCDVCGTEVATCNGRLVKLSGNEPEMVWDYSNAIVVPYVHKHCDMTRELVAQIARLRGRIVHVERIVTWPAEIARRALDRLRGIVRE